MNSAVDKEHLITQELSTTAEHLQPHLFLTPHQQDDYHRSKKLPLTITKIMFSEMSWRHIEAWTWAQALAGFWREKQPRMEAKAAAAEAWTPQVVQQVRHGSRLKTREQPPDKHKENKTVKMLSNLKLTSCYRAELKRRDGLRCAPLGQKKGLFDRQQQTSAVGPFFASIF